MSLKIQEYDSLKREILLHMQYEYTFFLATFTICGVFLGIALDSKNPYLCLLPILLVIPCMFYEAHFTENYIALGTYIRVFYEEKANNDIFWETRRNKIFVEKRHIDRKIPNIMSNLTLISYYIIFIASVGLYLFFEYGNKINIDENSISMSINSFAISIVTIIIIIIFLIAMILATITIVDKPKLRNRYLAAWEKIFDEENLK